MRPSTSAATLPASPAPAALTSPKSGATKRQRKAASAAVPLGDVTNLLLPETPTPIKPRRTARQPLPAPSDASAVSSTCSSSASVTPAPKPPTAASVTPAPKLPPAASVAPAPKPPSAASATPAPKPSPDASVTPAPKPSSAAVLEEEGFVVRSPTISTVYARRGATEAQARRTRKNPTAANDKGKEPVGAAGTASCPPLGKSTRIRKKDTRSISSSAPCHGAKKKRAASSTPKLPEDFVKKQRAYFADIDAFELPVEEVSESEVE